MSVIIFNSVIQTKTENGQDKLYGVFSCIEHVQCVFISHDCLIYMNVNVDFYSIHTYLRR